MTVRVAPFLLLTVLLAAPLPAGAQAHPSAGPVRVTALAVAETDQGFVGQHSTIEATVLGGGTGNVYVSTKPLTQQDIQGSVRLAAQVAATTLGVDWRQQDYLVSFESESEVIGGPSAGGIMTLALTTALHNLLHPEAPWTLDPTVAATGTINPDGTIGPVGGIPAKAEGAAAVGVKTFLFPVGQDEATTVVATARGLAQVSVDMAQHCAGLNITCRPYATLRDLIEAAAHVHLVLPDVAAPATSSYATVLAPTVGQQVQALQDRLAAAQASPALARLPATQKAAVTASADEAARDLQAAQDALAAQQFYQAATLGFKGAIATATAENLTAYYAARTPQTVVIAAIATCQNAVNAAHAEVDALQAGDVNALYAVGSAQQRTRDASNLLAQAQQQYQSARSGSGWVQALGTAAFCTERAGTATWWAGLRNLFPAGPAIASPDDLAQQAIEQANEMVGYADAVLSTSVADAHAKLEAAVAQQAAGHAAAAVLDAVDAQTTASVAMQTGGGTQVPAGLLDAARDGAARAISQARDAGAEPMLSVSLVELAQSAGQDPTASLQEYWNARTLALVDGATGAAPGSQDVPASQTVPMAPVGSGGGYGDATLLAFLSMGVLVGLAAAGVVVVFLSRRM